MIRYIKGILAETGEGEIVVECNGIGYSIMVPGSTMSELPSIGDDVKIYTFLYVKEDILDLYGFLSKDDLYVFKLLITVNGIGPKGALNILSVITPDDLRFAVLSDDVKAIQKAPGIGGKTAQKLIIELKDKLKLEDAFESKLSKNEDTAVVTGDSRGEAIEALIALGYSNSEAAKAVRGVEIDDSKDSEAILREALKKLAFL